MKDSIILKMFLDKYDKDKNLYKYLSNDIIGKLNKIDLTKIDLKKKLKESLIDSVHYSWFIPFLNNFSSKEASIFLSVLKPSYKKSLKKLLNLEEINHSLNPFLKKFLKEKLVSSLISKQDNILPLNSLLESKMNVLLTLNKNELIKLIDFLSFYDFIKEIKFIIEKTKLKKIYSYFTKEEKEFIKQILNYSEPFTSQKLSLTKYVDNKKKFRTSLHTRGLARLSYALSSENIDLIWYICHYLDIGRGNYIFKHYKFDKKKIVVDTIQKQILNIINLITKK